MSVSTKNWAVKFRHDDGTIAKYYVGASSRPEAVSGAFQYHLLEDFGDTAEEFQLVSAEIDDLGSGTSSISS